MQIKIVYFSGTGNTRFLSEKLVREFVERGNNKVELIPVEKAIQDIGPLEMENLVLGIAYPVYDLMPPRIIMEFINQLKSTEYYNYAFVFSTYTSYPLDANCYAVAKLQEKGFRVIAQENFKAPGASAYFYSNPGSPLVRGITIFSKGIDQKIKSFTERIMKSVSQNEGPISIRHHRLNKFHRAFSKMTFGMMFYRNLKVNGNCIQCGQCVKACPDSNLVMENGKLSIRRSNGCMRCLRCVQTCKKRAINFTSSKRRGNYTADVIESAYENAASTR